MSVKILLLAAMLATVGCASTVTFQGKSSYKVSAAPPAPPPPPKKDERVARKGGQIVIKEKVQFELNRSTILEVSFGLLDEVAAVIQKNPDIKQIEIGGHASSEGGAGLNRQLSQRRAEAVMKYLVDKGVAKERLSAKGYGEDKPIADNESEEGREKNRRVEFTIVAEEGGAQ